MYFVIFFFSSRRRHTRFDCDWSSDVCSSDLETSKVVRLATRELGVQSAIAKGALRPQSPFGAALELLSEGVAQLYHRDSRELQTLAAFDVTALRRGLATSLGRFAGATTLAEVM